MFRTTPGRPSAPPRLSDDTPRAAVLPGQRDDCGANAPGAEEGDAGDRLPQWHLARPEFGTLSGRSPPWTGARPAISRDNIWRSNTAGRRAAPSGTVLQQVPRPMNAPHRLKRSSSCGDARPIPVVHQQPKHRSVCCRSACCQHRDVLKMTQARRRQSAAFTDYIRHELPTHSLMNKRSSRSRRRRFHRRRGRSSPHRLPAVACEGRERLGSRVILCIGHLSRI
jgi:hypothetical protein